jgi:RNA polymerase sigma factor (sigma-70 family)
VSDTIKLPHEHDEGCHKIMEHMPPQEDFQTVAALMKQLDDPSRLRIFWILCHVEECVTDIAAMTDMSSPAVSHHLRILKTSELIVSRREGKEMYYRAAETDIAQKLTSAKAIRLVNSVLDARQRKIIILRYGLGGRKPLTQKQVAERLNISRSYVSRIEKSALCKLKDHF